MDAPVDDTLNDTRAGRVRVLLYAAAPGDAPDAVAAAYHRVSQDLQGTEGLLGNELLASVVEPGRFIVISEWTSLAAFRVWEEGSAHRGTTAALRPYQDSSRGSPYGIYEVAAAY